MSDAIFQPIIEIEKVTIRNAERLIALAQKIGNHKTGAHFKRHLEHQEQGKRQLLIASLDGQDAGYCVLNWYPKYAMFRRLNIPEVQELHVLPEMRRNGVARALIAYCEDWARKQNYDTMGIGVGLTASFGPAQRLYTMLGYIPDGAGVNYDRLPVTPGEFRPIDDQLCLMMTKGL